MWHASPRPSRVHDLGTAAARCWRRTMARLAWCCLGMTVEKKREYHGDEMEALGTAPVVQGSLAAKVYVSYCSNCPCPLGQAVTSYLRC
jgi:hypothetical protein